MQTQTVQNSPLLSGNTASGRSSNAAQEDQQFAQALNHQIERQANALPPSAQQAAPSAAQRRAEAPKPAAPQPQPQPQSQSQAQANQQASRTANAQAPAKPAAQAPAKAQQNNQSAEAQQADGAKADAAAPNANAAADSASSTASGAPATEQTDDTQASSNAVADMLAMIQGYGQAPATDAAAAAAAAAAATAAAGKDGRASDAELSGDAVLDGKGGRTGIADRLPTEGMTVDQATLLAAKTAADGAAAGKAAASDQDSNMADALAKLGQGAATDAAGTDKAAAQPGADFKAALQQANDASKAADLAARETKQAIQPQASALQAAAAALAPAGAGNAQAAQAAASNQLNARVGSQGWDHQLGQKVVWMVNGGEQSATLTLNPPDLGPLQVVLSVSNDQASVAFTAAQPEVRQALEQALPKLRETMGEAGITLGNTSVSSGSQDQQQAFAEMASGGRGRGVANGQNGNGVDGESSTQATPQVRRSVLGAVDTFA